MGAEPDSEKGLHHTTSSPCSGGLSRMSSSCLADRCHRAVVVIMVEGAEDSEYLLRRFQAE